MRSVVNSQWRGGNEVKNDQPSFLHIYNSCVYTRANTVPAKDIPGYFLLGLMVRYGCGRIYRVYEFRLGNNVLVSSQLVFASRELVTKKAAPVSDLHLVSIIASTRSKR